MNNLLENVARKLCVFDGLNPDEDYRYDSKTGVTIDISDEDPRRWTIYQGKARIAISAICDEIDEGGLESAARAFVNGMGENDGPTEDVFNQASPEDKAMFIGVMSGAIKSYLAHLKSTTETKGAV